MKKINITFTKNNQIQRKQEQKKKLFSWNPCNLLHILNEVIKLSQMSSKKEYNMEKWVYLMQSKAVNSSPQITGTWAFQSKINLDMS